MATAAHQEVEQEAARFFGTETALYLPNGYAFGLVAIAALRDTFKAIFFDEWAHHALRDGIAASGLPSYAFRHLESEDLAAKLKRHLPAGVLPLIVTDGLYSTFGEIAPLDEFVRVVAPYGGRLVVDESRSFGVLGERGRGALEHFGLRGVECPERRVHRQGARRAGRSPALEPGRFSGIVRHSSCAGRCGRGLPSAAAMCARSLRHIREHPELLRRLRSNITTLKSGLRNLGLQIIDNLAPVASFVSGTEQSMRGLQSRLMSEGIFVFYSTYIGAGASGVIRCGIFADHTAEHIERLLERVASQSIERDRHCAQSGSARGSRQQESLDTCGAPPARSS